MLTSRFDYQLPPELIAQEPTEPRDAARMLVADPADGEPSHHRVADLDQFLNPNDLLVINRTRVFPARLFGRKHSGGEVEVLLIRKISDATEQSERWSCYIGGRVKEGVAITIDDAAVEVIACADDGTREIRFARDIDVLSLAERVGRIPLPPYIKREDRPDDRKRYQSIFAENIGSVAAPTASLHFTHGLIDRIRAKHVGIADVDLAIGPGTFKPVATEQLEDHRIHAEFCRCPDTTVAAITACKKRGGRVIAVGTTVVRTLETAAQDGQLMPYAGWSSLYLHPPKRLRVVDGLLTNFHLPRSSLLMLVSCLTGVDRLLALYAEAVAKSYRFYSYGDAMLLAPQA